VKLPDLGRQSLARRLVLLAAVWSLVVLIASGIGLGFLFQQSVLRRIDVTLLALTDDLISGTTVDNGAVVGPALTDVRAVRTYSGLYWQIAETAPGGRLRPLVRSRSLWDSELTAPLAVTNKLVAQPGQPVYYETRGPLGEPLRAMARTTRLPARATPVVFMAAEDRRPGDRDARNFGLLISLAVAIMGAGLLTAVVIQVRVGLQPLFALRREVASVRRGVAQRIVRTYPEELKPLADELNALVEHNQEVIERQRTHVGNLAHALKTPLSVMLTEAGQQPGPLAEVVSRQAEVMRGQVDHHLRRARAAARSQGQGERTSVASVLDELSRTLERIFQDQAIVIDWDAPEDLFFLGERQDLLEIAGNALENACKYGRKKVRATAEPLSDERLLLKVEDDGKGLTPRQREAALKRGARLDEKAPGSGLGLSIIDELARAYRGSLKLGQSGLGGLSVEIDLPRAGAAE
jgi:signal transduction histidine kinase